MDTQPTSTSGEGNIASSIQQHLSESSLGIQASQDQLIPNDLAVKLRVFESALWEAYRQVQSEEHIYWCSLHKVMKRVGMSLPLFTERLNQLWQNQFATKPTIQKRYDFGLEVDCTPTDRWRLRNQLIMVDGCPQFIIQMAPTKGTW